MSLRREEVDIPALVKKVNMITKPEVANVIICVMREDPTYNEEKFTQTDKGIIFQVSDLSINQLHVLNRTVEWLANKK